MKIIAMIPARMGSKRLARKNLRELAGIPLIVRAIRRCKAAGVFDEIWVNSEHPDFGPIAQAEGVHFHQRPEHLGNDQSTSEEFVAEFLEAHPCTFVVQVHSIAPLLGPSAIAGFVTELRKDQTDVLLSVVEENLECLFDGEPVNFSFDRKTNSQDLKPVQRIVWAITGWRRDTYLAAARAGQCATYSGRRAVFPIPRHAGHVIKTEEDLHLGEAMLSAFGEAQ